MKNVTRNSSENIVESWNLAAHLLPILLLVRVFRLAIRPFEPPVYNMKQSKNVAIKVTGSDKVILTT